MNERNEFIDFLFDNLSHYTYLFLSPISRSKLKADANQALEILIKKSEVERMLQVLKNFHEVQHIKLSSKFRASATIITLKNGTEILIDFVHKFVYKSVVYLDENIMLQKRITNSDGLAYANIEHSFEHTILDSFLKEKGISDQDYLNLNEMHFLIQEDLIEFFNNKYKTSFNSLIDLTEFRSSQKSAMLNSLGGMPVNRFTKKVNVRWHNFVGQMKQARII